MDLTAFLHENLGPWKSQRTSFYLEAAQEQGGRLDLTVAWLTDPEELAKLVPAASEVVAALHIDWQGTLVSGAYRGKSTLVLLPDGQALAWQQGQRWTGRYTYADQALTLGLSNGDHSSEERIWLGGKNLRMRALTVKRGEGYAMASFFSEIRSLPPQTPPTS